MEKVFSLGFIMLGLFVTSAEGKEVCNTLEECRKLQAKVEARLAELLKEVTPELTGILEVGVSQYEAERVCREEGMRLPTVRELALVSQSMGAQVISETKKDGYRHVEGTDSEGNPDHFYFSPKGYERPKGELYWLWSSSVHPDGSDNAYTLGFVDGDINFDVRGNTYYNYSAVRCVQSR